MSSLFCITWPPDKAIQVWLRKKSCRDSCFTILQRCIQNARFSSSNCGGIYYFDIMIRRVCYYFKKHKNDSYLRGSKEFSLKCFSKNFLEITYSLYNCNSLFFHLNNVDDIEKDIAIFPPQRWTTTNSSQQW